MYIHQMTCISPQQTQDDSFIQGKILSANEGKYLAVEPNYMELIPLGLLRRMGKVVKLGIGAGLPLLKDHPNLDGIILGTANGGLGDCFKFLHQIIQYEEGTLTPTSFVQSTANAVAGNLALMGKRTGYNSTHVNGGLSFESALAGAQMLLEEHTDNTYLVGAADEFDESNFNINRLLGLYKNEVVAGEGSAMFILNNQSKNAVAKILDVDQITYPSHEEIHQKLNNLLTKNNLNKEDIDVLVLGYTNPSATDEWYDDMATQFSETTVYQFKNLVGEYPTASAFACWVSAQLLKTGLLPADCLKKGVPGKVDRVLVYNHYRGNQHGFILIERI